LREALCSQVFDDSAGWRLGWQKLQELSNGFGLAFHLYTDVFGGVADPTIEAVPGCELVDVRSESDSLNNAFDANTDPL